MALHCQKPINRCMLGGGKCFHFWIGSCRARVPKLLRPVTPKTITFEVGDPTISFDSVQQINIVKIADLKAQNASRQFASFLLNI